MSSTALGTPRQNAAGLAAAGFGLLLVGALGPFSELATTLETSIGALVLVVALDQNPALLGTSLLVGRLPRRALARLLLVAVVSFGVVLAIDWALAGRFDALAVGLISLSLVVGAASLCRPTRPPWSSCAQA